MESEAILEVLVGAKAGRALEALKQTTCENRVLINWETGKVRARCDGCGWRAEDERDTRFEARVDGRNHVERTG